MSDDRPQRIRTQDEQFDEIRERALAGETEGGPIAPEHLPAKPADHEALERAKAAAYADPDVTALWMDEPRKDWEARLRRGRWSAPIKPGSIRERISTAVFRVRNRHLVDE